ncbi:MAG: hypothetical protein ACP6IS_05000 [Candidatus Asgardarchaeia archaeon]
MIFHFSYNKVLWRRYDRLLIVIAILIANFIFSYYFFIYFNHYTLITSANNEYVYISSFEVNNVSIPITSTINVNMTYTLVYDEFTSFGYAKIELFDPINQTVLVSKVNYSTGTVAWNESFYLDISRFKDLVGSTICVIGKVVIEGSSYFEDTATRNVTITRARTKINIFNYNAQVYYNSSFHLDGVLINVDNLTYVMNDFQIALDIVDINNTVLSLETTTNERGQFTFYLNNLSIIPKNYSIFLIFHGSIAFKQTTRNVTLEVTPRIAKILSSLSKTTSFVSSISQKYFEYLNINVSLVDVQTNNSLVYYSLKILLNESVIYFYDNISVSVFCEEILLPDTNGTYYLTLIAKKTNYAIENVTYQLLLLPRQIKYDSLEYNENTTLYFGVSNQLKLTIYDAATKRIIKNSTGAIVNVEILNIARKISLNCTVVSSEFYSNGTLMINFIAPFNLYLEYLNNESMSEYILEITIRLNDSAYAPLVIFANVSNLQLRINFIFNLQANNLNVEKGDLLSLILNVYIVDSINSTIRINFFIDDIYVFCVNSSTNVNNYLNISLPTQNLSISKHSLSITLFYNDKEIGIVQLTFWVWLKTYINLKIYPANQK